jgi:hypothetical protein
MRRLFNYLKSVGIRNNPVYIANVPIIYYNKYFDIEIYHYGGRVEHEWWLQNNKCYCRKMVIFDTEFELYSYRGLSPPTLIILNHDFYVAYNIDRFNTINYRDKTETIQDDMYPLIK